MTVLARFVARGHPELRATHGKTLEFTRDTAITGRATCVVGVAAELPARAVAGPLQLTLTAGGQSVSWHAVGNSGWQPGGSAVIRRSGRRLPDTFATDADLAAKDLPRDLVRGLESETGTVNLVIERAAGPAGGTLIRFRLGAGSGERLRAEAAAADLVVAEDAAARSLADLPIGRPPEARAVLTGGGRVLAVGTTGDADLTALIAAAGQVEVLGLPAEQVVSAAATDRAATLLATHLAVRELVPLAAANPGLAVVFRCPVEELPRLLASLGRDQAQLVAVALDDPERPFRGGLSAIELPERGELVCRVAGRPEGTQAAPVDPAELVRGLLAQSVTPRSVALALAGLPGWSRRAAYDFVLSLSGENRS